jgi:hypothetical protein
MSEVKEVFRGYYVTVFRDETDRESIVYGSGSDWMSQLAKVTNHVRPRCRSWHGDRKRAEDDAIERLTLNGRVNE